MFHIQLESFKREFLHCLNLKLQNSFINCFVEANLTELLLGCGLSHSLVLLACSRLALFGSDCGWQSKNPNFQIPIEKRNNALKVRTAYLYLVSYES